MSFISPNLTINAARLKQDFDELAQIGATVGGGVSRLALSNEDLAARAWFANRIEEAGLLVRDDEVGNLSGVLPADDPHALTLLIGSHLDTVPNGGLYDGSIGVLAGLEILRCLREAKLDLPVHLEVIDFTDEEGNWQAFFGSMGLTGTLQAAHMDDTEQDNAAFRAALFRAGIRPSEVYKARRDPASLLAYLELHVEQGDKLDKAGCRLGIVTDIVGRSTYDVTFYGQAAHAGTTDMEQRRDALQGTATFITQAHALVRVHYPAGVVNCGHVRVRPGSFSVIPSEASLRLECRHPDERQLAEMEARLLALAQGCAHEYDLTVSVHRNIHRSAAHMDPNLSAFIEDIARAQQSEPLRLVSYAGHDAQMMASFTPTGLIFIPSVGGLSHNPREFTRWDDVVLGSNILLQTALGLIAQEAQRLASRKVSASVNGQNDHETLAARGGEG